MTIFGWDLSHYDGPDSRPAVGQGFAFFTHKAGGDANDAELGAWWDLMKGYRSNVLLGAYWVLYPGSAAIRADAFISRLDSQCDGWRDGPFILQVDCEKWNNDPGTVPSKADIKAFCDRLVQRCPKLRPIVYAPGWVYGDSLDGLAYPLWASRYSAASNGTASGIYAGIGGDSSSKWDAYSGQVPAILQFTSSATIAGQTTCDANAYRGTLAQLTALVAPGWMAKEVVTDMELSDKIGDKVNPDRDVGDVLRDIAKWRGLLFGDANDTKNAALNPKAPLGTLLAMPGTVAGLTQSMGDLATMINLVSQSVTSLQAQVAELAAKVGDVPATVVEITKETVVDGVKTAMREGTGAVQ